MSRDWTKEYWDIPDNAKDSYVELKQENEQLKKQLDIAIDALNEYHDSDWTYGYEWHDVTGKYSNGYEIAEKALKQIEELTK